MGKKERTRQYILEKAAPIFNTKGYNGTTLQDIVKATGMTKGAIYGNFDNKDNVAVEVFEYTSMKVLELLAVDVRREKNAGDKLRAIVRFYSDYIIDPPILGGCPVLNTAVEADDMHPALRARVVRTIEILMFSIRKIMHRGIKEGQLKADIDVESLAVMFFSSMTGGIMMSKAQGDTRSYDILAKRLEKEIAEMEV